MFRRTIIVIAATVLSACAAAPAGQTDSRPRFTADIRRTAYGVPHIEARDVGGIGYGFGYASAQDNICEIMDRYMTVRGERALHLGPGNNDANIDSDLYYRRLIALGGPEAALAGAKDSPDTPSAKGAMSPASTATFARQTAPPSRTRGARARPG
jgi:acyl-homoserine-lactone acylase